MLLGRKASTRFRAKSLLTSLHFHSVQWNKLSDRNTETLLWRYETSWQNCCMPRPKTLIELSMWDNW